MDSHQVYFYCIVQHPLSQGVTEVTKGKGYVRKGTMLNVLQCFYSCLVCAGGGWNYSKLLVVMEESFKERAGHAGMLSGADAACGTGCRKQDIWKRDNASATELFTPTI